MRAFLYARVSTKDKGQETENQLADMRRLSESLKWSLEHEYVDHESGGTSERAQLQAMMAACSQRKADVVMFWALDRLTREGALPTLQYLNMLTSYGVGFRSYSEPYLDSCGIFKDAVISILATIAKQERIRMSERVKAGMARAKEAGAVFGRPRLNPDSAGIAVLRNRGLSLRAIAKRVGVSEASVRRVLKQAAQPRQNGV